MNSKLLLFDLDGTLLNSQKEISDYTFEALMRAREAGNIIGVSTSRSNPNLPSGIERLKPEVLITSGGALVIVNDECVGKYIFDEKETKDLIKTARLICGNEVEITIDTLTEHYWNYKIDPNVYDKEWHGTIWTDFSDFNNVCLKMCVEIFDDDKVEELIKALPDCDAIRFSDGFWYKFTRKNITKENAINLICDKLNIDVKDIYAFGDDYADIGMLKMAGKGIAMGNSIPELMAVADIVIGSNDEDGIGKFIDSFLKNSQ
ncbi:MAG: Cof-type HAD-IIB family hydrolase [Clostridia bacterium]|nr:Cof-type HAD-IIB family hydrolase [Clostridia bacterium]